MWRTLACSHRVKGLEGSSNTLQEAFPEVVEGHDSGFHGDDGEDGHGNLRIRRACPSVEAEVEGAWTRHGEPKQQEDFPQESVHLACAGTTGKNVNTLWGELTSGKNSKIQEAKQKLEVALHSKPRMPSTYYRPGAHARDP